MKRPLVLFASLALPAFAQEAASAAEAPSAAPAAPAVAAAPAAAPAAPTPASAILPRVPARGAAWERLPEDEREHVRRMAEFRALRDAAERELLDIGKKAQARKDAICGENEEAKALRDRIAELQTEYADATNRLEAIYREDEELGKLAERVEPARRIVETNQRALNQEVLEAMKKRMAEQRAAYEEAHPAPERPAPTPESTGMDPQAFSNLFVRPPRPPRPAGPLPVNPDIKPPLGARPAAPAPAAE